MIFLKPPRIKNLETYSSQKYTDYVQRHLVQRKRMCRYLVPAIQKRYFRLMIQISQKLVIPIEPYLVDTVNEVWLFLDIWAQYKRLYLYCGDYKAKRHVLT